MSEITDPNCIVKAFEGANIAILKEIGDNSSTKYWFRARDIEKTLEMTNINASIQNYTEREKGLKDIDTLGGKQKAVFLTSHGVYRLLYNSKKQKAEKFREWVGDILDDIKLSGKQSKYLNIIKDVMNRGEIVTHILNWKVSNEPSNPVGTGIRKAVHSLIHDIPQMYIAEGNPGVTIRWLMPDVTSSSYYYTNSIYNDRITKAHVKIMMRGLVRQIKDGERHATLRARNDYNADWGISYLITKPLEYGEGEVAAGDVQ